MRYLLSLAILVASFTLAGCSSQDRSVVAPDNPVPPPSELPSQPGSMQGTTKPPAMP